MKQWEGLTPPYRTIVADPPWALHDAKLRPWKMGAGGRRYRATEVPYSFMSTDDICAMPVPELAEDNAHLYLWVPAKFNREGIGVRVAEAWSFKVVGEIVWRKPNFGLGAFPRPQHEILLVCRRGKLPFALRNIGSVQDWAQDYGNHGGKAHSVKPRGCMDLVESASQGPYVELFARQPRLGWSSWGWGYE